MPFCHFETTFRQDVLTLHVLEATLFIPLEDLSKMIKVSRHERVKFMIIVQEKHAIPNEVIDELAQYHLLSDFSLHRLQCLVYFLY